MIPISHRNAHEGPKIPYEFPSRLRELIFPRERGNFSLQYLFVPRHFAMHRIFIGSLIRTFVGLNSDKYRFFAISFIFTWQIMEIGQEWTYSRFSCRNSFCNSYVRPIQLAKFNLEPRKLSFPAFCTSRIYAFFCVREYKLSKTLQLVVFKLNIGFIYFIWSLFELNTTKRRKKESGIRVSHSLLWFYRNAEHCLLVCY